MEINSIMALLDALERTGWTKFEVEENGFHLKLERENAHGMLLAPAVEQPAAPAPVVAQQTPQPIAPEAPAAELTVPTVKGKDITSPLVGVYHKLTGDKEVKVGDKLKKGDTICMVEAMKLMNEITMPEDGEIVFFYADEGETVEYGQVIAKYI